MLAVSHRALDTRSTLLLPPRMDDHPGTINPAALNASGKSTVTPCPKRPAVRRVRAHATTRYKAAVRAGAIATAVHSVLVLTMSAIQRPPLLQTSSPSPAHAASNAVARPTSITPSSVTAKVVRLTTGRFHMSIQIVATRSPLQRRGQDVMMG